MIFLGTASPICTHAPSTLRAACAPRSCPYIYMLLAPQSSAHRTPPLRMCPSYASAGSRGWPAHLRKPQPTSNRSPQSLSAGGRALSSAPTVGYARKREILRSMRCASSGKCAGQHAEWVWGMRECEPRRCGGGDHEKTRRPRGGGIAVRITEPRTRRGALTALSTLGETYREGAATRPRRSSKPYKRVECALGT